VRFLKKPDITSSYNLEDLISAENLEDQPTRQTIQPLEVVPKSNSNSSKSTDCGEKNLQVNQDDSDSDSSKKIQNVENQLVPHSESAPPVAPRALRDRSTIKPPVQYGFCHYYKPNTFKSAIRCNNSKYWRGAIEKEINSIENHNIWEDYSNEPPNPLNTTWVFWIKDNTHGDPLKFKACLCVQGFNQIYGIDYEDKFAPTGKVSTVQMILLYSIHKNLLVKQFNIQGAFLHASLSEDVFIKTPKGVN
jgi:hypothetical protein